MSATEYTRGNEKEFGRKVVIGDGEMMGALWILFGVGLILFRWVVQKELDRHRLEDCQYQEEYEKKDLD